MEMLVLAPCLSSVLKYDGVFTLQLSGDGPVKTVLADITSNGDLRGYANFNEMLVEELNIEPGRQTSLPRLTGTGYIAFTVDQGNKGERYQGIVELSGSTLTDCTHAYFQNSEQLETVINLAVEHTSSGDWKGAAIMIQRLPFSGGQGIPKGITEDEYDEGWRNAAVMLGSCKPTDLKNNLTTPTQLLFKLFHETGVRVFPTKSVRAKCRCSVEKVERVLRSLKSVEIDDMKINGVISVKCEFCKTEKIYDDKALVEIYKDVQNHK
jgi:molecular chaperone Hsp33